MAFAATATILAVPALLLPFASVSKLGAPRVTHAYDGAWALWDYGLPFLASWVAVCAVLGPVVLAVSLLVALTGAWRRGAPPARRLAERLAHALEAWAMPEVHVLAVLVSFVRIETLADVTLGPAFYCYSAMAIALVAATRSFRFEPHPQ